MSQERLRRRAGGVKFKWIKVIEGGYIDLGISLVGTRCNAAEQEGWCHDILLLQWWIEPTVFPTDTRSMKQLSLCPKMFEIGWNKL